MSLFYPLVILLIGISFCIKDKQREFIFYSLVIGLIIILSLRGSPDEYARYMLIEANNASQILEGFPFSESIFRLIAFLSLQTPFPRFTIYFATYSFTFFAIFRGLELYKLGSLSKVLPVCFFLSHHFLSLGYVAIRPGLSNAVAFWAISYLFTRDKRKIIFQMYFSVAGRSSTKITLFFIFKINSQFDIRQIASNEAN